jgi:sec-independent protein translocase protein TatB
MEIFGVGPLEFLLILVIALVILGPEDMVGTARKIGQWIYRVVRSPTWRAIIESTNELRNLPQQIVRDAGLQEAVNEVKQTASDVRSQMTETTSAISGEMAAATRDINSEMRAATGDVAKELNAASPTALLTNEEIRAAALKRALAEGENAAPPEIIWPENNVAGSDPNLLTAPGEPVVSASDSPTALEDASATTSAATEETLASGANADAAGPEPFAQALGTSNEIQSDTSVEPGENATPGAPMGLMPPAMIDPEQQEVFPAQQGTLPEQRETSHEVSQAAAAVQASEEEPAHHLSDPIAGGPMAQYVAGITPLAASKPEAPGAPLSLPGMDNGFEARMQDQMAEMLKALEKLEQASLAPAPPGETPAVPDSNQEA